MLQLSTFLGDLMCNGINPNNCRVCLNKEGEVRKEGGKKKMGFLFFSPPSW